MTTATTAKTALSAFGSGLLFGVGLLVSGMTDPHRVRAFLDFAGNWNPSLAGVMAAAIAVHGTALWLERRRLGVTLGAQAPIDTRLVAGAAVFGVGWGLAGYCPGPAVVSLGIVPGHTWVFFATMILGVLLGDAIGGRGASRDPSANAARAPAC
jgi:uncharacterized membrane protein YedE/YeeE